QVWRDTPQARSACSPTTRNDSPRSAAVLAICASTSIKRFMTTSLDCKPPLPFGPLPASRPYALKSLPLPVLAAPCMSGPCCAFGVKVIGARTPRPAYLTSGHTWSTGVDIARGNLSKCSEFDAYMDLLERHGRNTTVARRKVRERQGAVKPASAPGWQV